MFILHFLVPLGIGELKLISLFGGCWEGPNGVGLNHGGTGYRAVREALAEHYNLGSREPNIQVHSVNLRGDRSLTLHHSRHDRKPLDESAQEVLRHLHRLWGFEVRLYSIENERIVRSEEHT